MKVNKCNPLYKQSERKIHGHLMRFTEGLWQNPLLLYGKSSAEIRSTRYIPKHNKGNLQ